MSYYAPSIEKVNSRHLKNCLVSEIRQQLGFAFHMLDATEEETNEFVVKAILETKSNLEILFTML